MNYLKKSEIEQIIGKIKKSLRQGGIFCFSDFSTHDPLFQKIESGNRRLFTKEEVKNYFKDKNFKVIK